MALRFTLRQLEYFVAVGEAGSVALAARRLNVSSPSISAAITQLEEGFGVQLFLRRHAHALTLTRAGRQLIDQARAVLAAGESLTGAAAEMGARVAGPLALGTLTSLAALILPALRRGFEAAHPEVAITQQALDHAELLAALGELGDEPMVLLDLPHSAEYFQTVLAAHGAAPRIAERTRDMAMLRSLVANGYGFSLVNTPTRLKEAPDGQPLAFVAIAEPVTRLRLGLARTEGRARRAVAAFAAHCAAHVGAYGLPGCITLSDPANDAREE